MERIDVSIIIVNYKTINMLVDSICSIRKFTCDLLYEIIVVDNNSGDGCEDVLSKQFGLEHDIIYVGLSENVGFGLANNAGVKMAKGRNIFFLNPDTVLLNNAIKILSDYLDAHMEVGVCGGNLYDEQMKPTLSYMTFLPSITKELDDLTHGYLSRKRNRNSTRFNYTGHTLAVGYITGADMMTRRSVFEAVGGFSPAFFMYYEETELTFRIRQAGYEIHSVPTAKIQHLEGKSFAPALVNERKIMMSEQGRKRYYKLHYSWPYVFSANVIYVLFLLSRITLFKFRGSEREKSFRCRLKFFLM